MIKHNHSGGTDRGTGRSPADFLLEGAAKLELPLLRGVGSGTVFLAF